MEETVVKKVLDSFSDFLTKTKLSSHAKLTVDWDTLAKEMPDDEEFNTNLTSLVGELQDFTSKKEDVPTESLSQSNPPSQTSSSTTIKEEVTMPDARLDPMFVQISASNSEIDRRIQAFIEKKQVEIDDNNRREFATASSSNSSSSSDQGDTSCARTDASFKCRSGWRSHVKVSKVVNIQGPQTRPAMVHHLTSLIQSPVKSSRLHQAKSPLSSSYQSSVEERLRNMESHLKMRRGHGSSSDIYERLKILEKRILHLESVSPEYLDVVNTFNKRQRLEMGSPGNQEFSINEIDNKIEQLQKSILKRKLDLSHDPSTSSAGHG